MADQPDLLAALQASIDRAKAGRLPKPAPVEEFDGGAEEDGPGCHWVDCPHGSNCVHAAQGEP